MKMRVGAPDLDQLAEIHVSSVVRHARGLLHVVRHDHDREILLELA